MILRSVKPFIFPPWLINNSRLREFEKKLWVRHGLLLQHTGSAWGKSVCLHRIYQGLIWACSTEVATVAEVRNQPLRDSSSEWQVNVPWKHIFSPSGRGCAGAGRLAVGGPLSLSDWCSAKVHGMSSLGDGLLWDRSCWLGLKVLGQELCLRGYTHS